MFITGSGQWHGGVRRLPFDEVSEVIDGDGRPQHRLAGKDVVYNGCIVFLRVKIVILACFITIITNMVVYGVLMLQYQQGLSKGNKLKSEHLTQCQNNNICYNMVYIMG